MEWDSETFTIFIFLISYFLRIKILLKDQIKEEIGEVHPLSSIPPDFFPKFVRIS